MSVKHRGHCRYHSVSVRCLGGGGMLSEGMSCSYITYITLPPTILHRSLYMLT